MTQKKNGQSFIATIGERLRWLDVIAEACEVLELHHNHHLQAAPAGVQGKDGEWREVDTASAYRRSSLCKRTEALIYGHGPALKED